LAWFGFGLVFLIGFFTVQFLVIFCGFLDLIGFSVFLLIPVKSGIKHFRKMKSAFVFEVVFVVTI